MDLKTVLSNCDAKRDHNYSLGADSFTITTREYQALKDGLPGPNGGWNDAVEAAAKLLRASADACTPGSPAEQQNWPFVLETMAREVSKLRIPATGMPAAEQKR